MKKTSGAGAASNCLGDVEILKRGDSVLLSNIASSWRQRDFQYLKTQVSRIHAGESVWRGRLRSMSMSPVRENALQMRLQFDEAASAVADEDDNDAEVLVSQRFEVWMCTDEDPVSACDSRSGHVALFARDANGAAVFDTLNMVSLSVSPGERRRGAHNNNNNNNNNGPWLRVESASSARSGGGAAADDDEDSDVETVATENTDADADSDVETVATENTDADAKPVADAESVGVETVAAEDDQDGDTSCQLS